MAALIAREDLDVAADRALGHYTHEKSSVGCAAALATLDVIRDEGLLERSRELGVFGLERLRRMEPVNAVRGLGVSFGVEVAGPAVAEAVMYRCLTNGLSFKVGGGNVLTLCPPLTISCAELIRRCISWKRRSTICHCEERERARQSPSRCVLLMGIAASLRSSQ